MLKLTCVYVCVCERERERDGERQTETQSKNLTRYHLIIMLCKCTNYLTDSTNKLLSNIH